MKNKVTNKQVNLAIECFWHYGIATNVEKASELNEDEEQRLCIFVNGYTIEITSREIKRRAKEFEEVKKIRAKEAL